MQIQWLGQSCFKIQTKNSAGEITIITNPLLAASGLKMPRLQADIITLSNEEYSKESNGFKGDPFIIYEPGEYETKEVFIYGLLGWRDENKNSASGQNILYRLTLEDLNLVHLGDLAQELNDEQLEKLNNVDILLLPVGGPPSLSPQKAQELIAEVEPRIVIPMNYKIPGLKVKANSLDDFLKITGLPSEKIEKFKINKKNLPQEETRIIVLTP